MGACTDRFIPTEFSEGCLITGLSGTALKPNYSRKTMKMSDVPEGRKNICIIHPNKDAYSETFIHNHIRHLPGKVHVSLSTGDAYPSGE